MLDAWPGKLPAGIQFLNNYNIHDETLKNLIELFYFEARSGGPGGPAFIESLLGTLARYFVENFSNLNYLLAKQPVSRLSVHRLETVKAHIRENLGENLTVDELAAEANMSKFYFLREFKKATGQTPHQFVAAPKSKR